MNASVSKRPRLMCRLVQGWTSVFGEGGAAPRRGIGASHVAECECCRRFFRDCATLESSLRREAGREKETAGTDLERRIIDAIHRSARPQPRRSSSMATLSLVGIAAVVALGFILSQKSPAPAGGPTMASVGPGAAGNPGQSPGPDVPWDGLSPAAGAILSGEPLQREADAVYSDARAAIGFLALNFLPSVPDSFAPGADKAAPAAHAIGG